MLLGSRKPPTGQGMPLRLVLPIPDAVRQHNIGPQLLVWGCSSRCSAGEVGALSRVRVCGRKIVDYRLATCVSNLDKLRCGGGCGSFPGLHRPQI